LKHSILVLLVVMTAGCALGNTTPSMEISTPTASSSCCLDTSTPGEPPQTPKTPTAPPRLGPLTGHSRGYLTTPQELETIKQKADQGLEPYATAVKAELAYAHQVYQAESLDVPDVLDFESSDIGSPPYLSRGSRQAYALALAYHLLKDSDPNLAEQYAMRAYELIMAMPRRSVQVTGYQANTRLNLSVYMPTFVYAADLLADWSVPGTGTRFYNSADNQLLKQWLGTVIFRYPYNAAHVRVNNWGAWARLTIAVIGDYVGDDAPLYGQQFVVDGRGMYVVNLKFPCNAGDVTTCVQVRGAEAYATALRLHFQFVDGKMYELSSSNCDGLGSKSMIRPDGGLPDELRREYTCDATDVPDPNGAASRYSQFATDAMISLAEVAWRRGNSDLYTHIDPQTQRGALYRCLEFMIRNQLLIGGASVFEMANRFYTYQITVEKDSAKREEWQRLLRADLPGILKEQGNWPAGATGGASFVSFGTLTHGFSPSEPITPPPTVAPRG
jgi:alginate lyase